MFLNENSFIFSSLPFLSVISLLSWHFCTFQYFWKRVPFIIFLCCRSKGICCIWWLLLNYRMKGSLGKMLGCFIWKQNLNTVCWYQRNVWQKRERNPSSGSQKWWRVWLKQVRLHVVEKAYRTVESLDLYQTYMVITWEEERFWFGMLFAVFGQKAVQRGKPHWTCNSLSETPLHESFSNWFKQRLLKRSH